MKHRIYCLIYSIFAILLISSPAIAQSPQNREGAPMGRRAQISPEQIARMKADSLSSELGLTEKQSKEIYKLYLQQANQLYTGGMGQFAQGGRPDGGRSMQGMPPGVDRGSMRQGGERPDMQQIQEMRRQFGGMIQSAESDKEIAKRDKKMKKILSTDQYERWCHIEKADTERRMVRIRESEVRESTRL